MEPRLDEIMNSKPDDQPESAAAASLDQSTALNTSAIPSRAASATLLTSGSRSFKKASIQTRRVGSGITGDIRARAPWYSSDWADAWNYRVIPATALIFFAKCGFRCFA